MLVPFTPGPWHIGMMPGPIVYGEKGEQIASLYPRMVPQDENGANARLIAAAPELLEALRETLRELVTPKGLPDAGKGRTREQQAALTTAYAAISKATGEAP